MKRNKIFLLVGIAVAGALASCSSDDDYCNLDSIVSGPQVFFSNKLETRIELSAEHNSISIPLNRANTDGAITVPLTTTSSSEEITVVPSVDFADGAEVAEVAISYNPDNLEYGKYDTLKIAIADECTTPYGASNITLLVGQSEPYVSIGKGYFKDGFTIDKTWEVEIEQSLLNPSSYRVVAPYREMWNYFLKEENDETYIAFSEASSDYLTFRILEKGSTLGFDQNGNPIEIIEEGLVYFEPTNTGELDDDYIWAYHPAHFTLASINLYKNNYVAGYKDDGTPGDIYLAPLYFEPSNGSGWNYTTSPGIMEIIMPGYDKKDYSAELSYSGIFTNTNDEVFAVGYLTLGEDVTEAKAVVVDASQDPSDVAAAIAAGEKEAIDVEAGRIEVPIAELTGNLKIIAAVIVDGEVKSVASTYFEYYGGASSPWVSLGMGQYTDDFIISMYANSEGEAFQPYTYAVEILEHSEKPGLYRIVNAYAPLAEAFGEEGGNKNIEINATDPNAVYFLAQPTGMDLGEGEISIVSEGGDFIEYFDGDVDYVKSNYPYVFGKLTDDGVITLPLFKDYNNNGDEYQYQGWFIKNGNYYPTGCNGAFELVLPDAAESVKAKAKAKAQATEFAMTLKAQSIKKNTNVRTKAKRIDAKKIVKPNSSLKLKPSL